MKAYIYNENGSLNRTFECDAFIPAVTSWFDFRKGDCEAGQSETILYTSHPFYTETDILEGGTKPHDEIADITFAVGDRLIKWSDCYSWKFSFGVLYFICGNKSVAVHGASIIDNIRTLQMTENQIKLQELEKTLTALETFQQNAPLAEAILEQPRTKIACMLAELDSRRAIERSHQARSKADLTDRS